VWWFASWEILLLGNFGNMKECGEKLGWKFMLVLPVLISVLFHGENKPLWYTRTNNEFINKTYILFWFEPWTPFYFMDNGSKVTSLMETHHKLNNLKHQSKCLLLPSYHSEFSKTVDIELEQKGLISYKSKWIDRFGD
jgi:hypothetical protein